jgi:hypothetical protein
LPVVLQISLSVILLVAAATMFRSTREFSADRGYATGGLTMVQFVDNPTRDTSRADYTRLQVRLGERMRSMGTSLQIATGGYYLGFSDSLRLSDWQIRVVGDRRLVSDDSYSPGVKERISDNYFRVLGIPIVAGRSFGDGERTGPPTSIIVSRRFAVDVWGSTAVIGKQLLVGKPGIPITVVGVAENIRRLGRVNDRAALVDGRDLYFSERQTLTFKGAPMYYFRSSLPPPALAAFASSAAKSLGYNLPAQVTGPRDRRLQFINQVLAVIVGVFAIISLLLATLGIYGMVAFSVEQRSREIGVRVALGAQGADVVRLLATSGAKLILVGTAIGLVGSAAAGRIVTSVVLASLGGHVATAFGVAGVFVLVGGVACYLPARRSIRIDPMNLLRE